MANRSAVFLEIGNHHKECLEGKKYSNAISGKQTLLLCGKRTEDIIQASMVTVTEKNKYIWHVNTNIMFN